MSDDLVKRARDLVGKWTDTHIGREGENWALLSDLADAASELADEIERLRTLIDEAGKPWMALNPGIPWEGGIDKAMAAAVGEIERLREGLNAAESQLAAWRKDPTPSMKMREENRALRERLEQEATIVNEACLTWFGENPPEHEGGGYTYRAIADCANYINKKLRALDGEK